MKNQLYKFHFQTFPFKRIVLMSCLLCCIQSIQAQTKVLHLKIDTLKSKDQFKTLSDFKIWIENQGFLNNGVFADSLSDYSLFTYPNYQNRLEIENDSSNIRIPVDLNGSYILFKNAKSFHSDTLSIDFWRLYDTKPADTSFMVIRYYKVLKGEVAETPYHVKLKKKTYKSKAMPTSIKIMVNGKPIDVRMSLSINPMRGEWRGHRYRPRNPYLRNGEDKKRSTYFHFVGKDLKSIWTSEVDLKTINDY